MKTVLDHITSMGSNNGLSLKELTLKNSYAPIPYQTIKIGGQLEVGAMHPHPDGVSFTPTHLSKQSQQGRPLKDFFSHPSNKIYCYAL